LVSRTIRNALDVSAYSADVPDQRLAGSIDAPSPRPDIWKEPHLQAAASIASRSVMTALSIDAFVEHSGGLKPR
jgi:hypothetical protein